MTYKTYGRPSHETTTNDFIINRTNYDIDLHPFLDFLKEQLKLCKLAPSSRTVVLNLWPAGRESKSDHYVTR